MKKIVALLLAMLLVLVNVAVLAEDIPDFEDSASEIIMKAAADGSTKGQLYFLKNYNVTGNTAADLYPDEKLTFTVTKYETSTHTNPDDTMITIAPNQAVTAQSNNQIAFVVPDTYTKAGEYFYEITETPGNTQGVDYSKAKKVYVKVFVLYENGALKATPVVYVNDTDTKDDKITNDYKVHKLSVQKKTDGNLVKPDSVYTFTVKLDAASGSVVRSDITIVTDGDVVSIKDGSTDITETKVIAHVNDTGWTTKTITVEAKKDGKIEFQDIPDNVTYTVTETLVDGVALETLDDKTTATQMAAANTPNAFYVDIDGTKGATSTAALTADKDMKLNNYKGVEIPTGIALDTVPYILILAVAMLGVVLAVRKREEY